MGRIAKLRHRDGSVEIASKAINAFPPFFVGGVYRCILCVEDHAGIEHVEENDSENGHNHG